MSDSDDCFGLFWELLKLCWWIVATIFEALVAIGGWIINAIRECHTERKQAKAERATKTEEGTGNTGETGSARKMEGTPEEVV
jgi:hypothetical protein